MSAVLQTSAPPLGIFHGLPNADYHASWALGSSGLKKLARSPRHFYASTLDPGRPVIDSTPAMKAGTLAHCVLLEPADVATRYIVKPQGHDGRTKEGKAWIESVTLGMEIVSSDQMLTAQRQAAAIRALPDVAKLLNNGRAEVSVFWNDEATGELCKARPDWVSPAGDGVILLDAKTATDAGPAGFAKAVANFSYAMQNVHYAEGFEAATGERVLGFVFAVAESDWPHAAAAYMLPDDWLAAARAQRRRLIDLYASCLASGAWPGYDEAIQLLDMPAWVAK